MHEIVVTIDAGHAAVAGFGMLALTAFAFWHDGGFLVARSARDTVAGTHPIAHGMGQPGFFGLPDLGVFIVQPGLAPQIADTVDDMRAGGAHKALWNVAISAFGAHAAGRRLVEIFDQSAGCAENANPGNATDKAIAPMQTIISRVL